MVLLCSPTMTPICTIETPFKEKFGVPRQSLLVAEAEGRMVFPKTDFYSEAFRGIENFTHLWILFSFHEAVEEGFKALIRPPRFLGKEKWGVFASRSPHRPNHLGISVVKFKSFEVLDKNIVLTVLGVDLVSGTPVLDIKPYIPYADSYPDALSGPFQERPVNKNVVWKTELGIDQKIKKLIEEVISLDPRSGSDELTSFGVSIAGYNVRFQMVNEEFHILEISKE